MKSSFRRLPDAELEVMNAVWSCEAPAARSEIEAILNRTHPMATTTVLTQLTRLTEKGFLHTEKQGRTNCYTPLISQHDYLACQSKRFVDTLFGGNMSTFAAALCDSGLSREDLDELRALLEKGGL